MSRESVRGKPGKEGAECVEVMMGGGGGGGGGGRE